MDEFTQEDLMRFFEKELYEAIEEEYGSRKDEDYDAMLPQAAKFLSAYYFIKKYVDERGGTIDPIRLSRKEEVGGFSAYFYLLDLYGDDLKQFCSLFSEASAITMEALTDGRVCFSCVFPGVFQKNNGT